MNGNLVRGANYLMEGLRMLGKPGVRPFVLIPLAINMVLFGGALWWGWQQVALLNAILLGWLPGWLEWLSWLLWPIFFLLALLLIVYGFSIVANLIAAPFNGYLAEKAEQLLLGKPLASENNWKSILLLVPRSIGRELRKMLYFIPLLLGIFILSMIPGINAIAAPLGFLVASWMMVLQYLDYPMDNHNMSFAQVKQGARQQRLTSLGFGATVMLGTMIPLVNLVIMPAAICGATIYWVRDVGRQNPHGAR
jgi:CysZ protein